MLEEIITALVVANTLFLVSLIVVLLKFKHSIPDIQQVLNDVGQSVAQQFSEVFEKPMVKKSMTILGKESGEVRADKALREKVANNFLESYPSAKFILDQLDITPLEGLQLMRDPLIGPLIQNVVSGGLSNFGASTNTSKNSKSLANPFNLG